MKKFLLSTFLLFAIAITAKSQPIILSENFDSYNGLVTSIPAGFTITWNDTAAISRSFYTSSGFCGVACNSYKFGVDSATIITPAFSNAGSVSFYIKGNGSVQPNTFYVYETPDGVNYTLIQSYNPLPTSGTIMTLPVNSASTNLKFYYEKDSLGFNAGFDDLIVYGPTGVNEVKGVQAIGVYPSPTTGIVNLNFNETYFNDVQVSLISILGKEVKRISLNSVSTKYAFNISDQSDGIYLVKIKSGSDELIKRVILKK